MTLEETHLVLVGLLLVADGQIRSVDVQVDVIVAGDAPAALLSRRHPLELHLGVMAMLPLLARRGQAVDPPVHIHRPQQGDGHGCTWDLGKRRTREWGQHGYCRLVQMTTMHVIYQVYHLYTDTTDTEELSP